MKRILALLFGASLGVAALATAPQIAAVQPESIAQASSEMTAPANPYTNTEWLLEDLAGTGVVDRVQGGTGPVVRAQTTLRFDQDRISGQGGCNQYTAPMQLTGDRFSVGAIASTRRACEPAVMDQEFRYLQALESAERIALEGEYLLVYSAGSEAPLRFSRLTPTLSINGETDR